MYTSLTCQLTVAEVRFEEAWHARFASGLASWRTLRTQHAIGLFNARLAGELSEPDARLDIYRLLRQDQAAAYQVMIVLVVKSQSGSVVLAVLLAWTFSDCSDRLQRIR